MGRGTQRGRRPRRPRPHASGATTWRREPAAGARGWSGQSTPDNPEQHVIGEVGEVDPDELFASRRGLGDQGDAGVAEHDAHPYDRPSDPAKRHSAALTDGPDRAAARAMLKAIGFTDDDLARPLDRRRDHLDRDDAVQLQPARAGRSGSRQGIRAAGGTPMEFNTISVSDGVSMGTEGMKASLVSREVIADSIELVARGHLFDGLVCLVGCDKTIPAAAMALARLDLPGLVLYSGSIAPGTFRGQDITIQDVFEAVGAYAAGKIDAEELHEVESAACPGAGACGGQFTANTMSTALEFLGISPAGLNGIPALNRGKGDAAEECGRLVDAARARRRPAVAHHHPRGDRERRGVGGGHRRLDQRRAASAGDRPRAGHPVLDRRVRLDRRPARRSSPA